MSNQKINEEVERLENEYENAPEVEKEYIKEKLQEINDNFEPAVKNKKSHKNRPNM